MHLESNEAHMHLESARQLVLSYSMKFEALPQRNFRTDIDLCMVHCWRQSQGPTTPRLLASPSLTSVI